MLLFASRFESNIINSDTNADQIAGMITMSFSAIKLPSTAAVDVRIPESGLTSRESEATPRYVGLTGESPDPETMVSYSGLIDVPCIAWDGRPAPAHPPMRVR